MPDSPADPHHATEMPSGPGREEGSQEFSWQGSHHPTCFLLSSKSFPRVFCHSLPMSTLCFSYYWPGTCLRGED